jgi:hypothetical protein
MNLTPRSLHLQRWSPKCPDWVGPGAGVDILEKRKIFVTVGNRTIGFLGCQARSLVSILSDKSTDIDSRERF